MNIQDKIDTTGARVARGPWPDSSAPLSRQVPQNIDAEQALIGALFLDNGVLDRVEDMVQAHHFYDPLHQRIWTVAGQMIGAGRLATPVTLRSDFEGAEPIMPGLEVWQYLGTLAGKATTIVNAPDYARTVRDLAVRRGVIIAAENMVAAAYEAELHTEPEALIEEGQVSLDQLRRTGSNERSAVTLDAAMGEAIETACAAFQRGGGLAGLSTGMRSLDAKLGGLTAGDLIILAGRPSMGKTGLATSIAQNIVTADKASPVVFFSLEMGESELAARILASMTGIPSWRMRKGELNQAEITKLVDARRKYASAPLHIDGSGSLTIPQIVSRARKMKRKHGVELIVVDYLQLLSGGAYRGNNRTAEVGEVSRALKGIAKELRVPVLALSQLSRNVESREDKRPQLSDLRESGSIEQDADIVMFVYRDEYYVERREPDVGNMEAHGKWKAELAACAGKAEAIIGKHRHGPVGTVTLGFEAEAAAFVDISGR
jgi:replicative DNA helicase